MRTGSRVAATIGFVIALVSPAPSDAAEIKVLTTRAMNHVLTELAGALKHDRRVPMLVPLQRALSEYDDAISELRRDRLIVPLKPEDASACSALLSLYSS